MSTQTRLTLSSVLVMTAIVAIISILDLGYQMDAQYAATLEHAELLKGMASNAVVEALNRDRQHPWREALQASNLQRSLIDIMSASHALLEIAVCDNDYEILMDSDPKSQGKKFPRYANFRPIVGNTNWLDKVRILGQQTSYQLEQPLGTPGKPDMLYVRVVIYPPLIRLDIMPTLKKSASVALASVAGALCITLLFSIIAFRPLGRLGHLLDLVAKGEYDPSALAPVSRTGADEFGIMASKVSLLGQQLRGAQFDFSDLRGNFERLLDQLEDAVLMFGRDRRLVVASGAVEKFLGQMRADLVGLALPEGFPSDRAARSTGGRRADVRARPPPGGGVRRGREIPGQNARRPGGPRPAGGFPAQYHAGADAGPGRANRASHPQPARAHHPRRWFGRIRGFALGGYPGASELGEQPRPRHRSAGALARSGGRPPSGPPTADGGPPFRHQPHHQRRGARGQEPAQRHPDARGAGAHETGPGGHRYRSANGNHLARDPAAGSRGEDFPGFHAARGTASGGGAAGFLCARNRGLGGAPSRGGRHPRLGQRGYGCGQYPRG